MQKDPTFDILHNVQEKVYIGITKNGDIMQYYAHCIKNFMSNGIKVVAAEAGSGGAAVVEAKERLLFVRKAAYEKSVVVAQNELLPAKKLNITSYNNNLVKIIQ